jgi:hypothetical protein
LVSLRPELGAFAARGFAGRRGRTRCGALTAIFGEIVDERIDRLELRRVNHRTAVAPNAHEGCHAQPVEVEGQRVRRQFERRGNLARRHSLRSRLDEKSKRVEPIVLGEGGEGRDGVGSFHISTNIETFSTLSSNISAFIEKSRRAN